LAATSFDETLLVWNRPDFHWCSLTEDLCIPPRRNGGFLVISDPFQHFKVLNADEPVDMELLGLALFNLKLYFQKKRLAMSVGQSALK